jgi:hypothetical protein
MRPNVRFGFAPALLVPTYLKNRAIKPFCTALHCTALHCTALHCTALKFNFVNEFSKIAASGQKEIPFPLLGETRLRGTALHCTALHCTKQHCTAHQHCTGQKVSSSSTGGRREQQNGAGPSRQKWRW